MRQCINCGAPLDDDALFCTVCGTRNEIMSNPQRQCPHCGAELDNDAIFCTYCGQKVLLTDSPVGAPVWSPDVRAQKQVEPTAVNVGEKSASTIRLWHYALGIGVLLIILAAVFVPKMLKDYGNAEQDNVAGQSDGTASDCSSGELVSQGDTYDSSESFNYEGRYAYQGSIDGKYGFRMNFNIEDNHIKGEYAVNGNKESVCLKGTITDDGIFKMYEYAKDGNKTGYYFTGQFNPENFRGQYLSTKSKIDMSFEAAPMELDSPIIDGIEDENLKGIEEDMDIPSSDVDDKDVSTDDEPLNRGAEDDRIYDITEESAQFPGGDEACYKWLSENIKYPSICEEQGIQGRVYVSFVVNMDGSIVDEKVVRSPDSSLSEEALRVVRLMPKWKPAKVGGKVVRSRFRLPIMFRLN